LPADDDRAADADRCHIIVIRNPRLQYEAVTLFHDQAVGLARGRGQRPVLAQTQTVPHGAAGCDVRLAGETLPAADQLCVAHAWTHAVEQHLEAIMRDV